MVGYYSQSYNFYFEKTNIPLSYEIWASTLYKLQELQGGRLNEPLTMTYNGNSPLVFL
jgi:hypothetical protein